MDEKKIVIEYFATDDSPATITDIEQLPELGKHYYKVKGKDEDEDGEFETSVFVDSDSSVQILPE